MFLVKAHALLLAGVLLGVLLGCRGTTGPSFQPATATIHRMSVPAADYFGAAWIDAASIVMARRAPNADGLTEPARLVRMSVDSTSVTELPFRPSNDECWRIQEFRPVRLPDGRLGFLRECQPREFDGIDFSVIWHDIVALDLRDGRQEVLAKLGNPWIHGEHRMLYSFSLRPDMSEGVAYLGTLICDGIARFDRSGLAALDFPLGPGPSARNLDESFQRDCPDTINVREPSWSPEGTELAVFVSTDASGRGGLDRLDAPWDLTILDPSTRTSQQWLSGLTDPRDVAWSPDGAWILADESASTDRSSIWVVHATDPRDRQIVRVELDARMTSIAWSPDGRTLVGLIDSTPDGDPADLLALPAMVDIGSILDGVG
jgi:hypothetical protein